MGNEHLSNSFIENFLLGEVQFNLAACVLGYLIAAALIGKILRRPWLESQSIGLLILMAGSTTALYLSRGLGFSIDVFGGLSLFFVAALTYLLRITAFKFPYQGRSAGAVVWYCFGVLTVIIWGVRILTPDPAAGYSFFQSWNPLYLDGSFKQNFFLLEPQMRQGTGFLTTGSIAYAADGLGLAALVKWLFGVESFHATNAYSIAAVIATVGMLLFAVRRSVFAVLAFALMFLIFYRYSPSLGVVTKNDWTDTALYLGGSTAMYYMVTGQGGRVARFGSAFASAMTVVSRSYGAMYSALIGLMGFSADVKSKRWRTHFIGWVIYAVVLGILSLREIILVVFGDVFHARSKMMEIHPRSIEKIWLGTLNDWGILPSASHFEFGVPMLLPTILMLVLLLVGKRCWSGHRLKALAIVLSPFLLLLGPFLVEVLTGFRKSLDFSKLYIFSIFFFCWYPCWLFSRVRLTEYIGSVAVKVEGLSKVLVPTLIIIAAIGFIANYNIATKWLQNATEVYKSTNPDIAIARGLRASFPQRDNWQCIVERPIVYFYYEPGIGLRSFIGGDVFEDYDFWSDEIQQKLEKSESLESILKNYNYPNLYVSFRGVQGYGIWMQTEAYKAYLDEIKNFKNASYVRETICSMGACFYVTGPTGGRSDSACLK